MNILIVNAFGSSSQDKSKFTLFCNLIKDSLKIFSQNSGIDNFCFIYRTPNTISDFIYNGDCNPGEETKESLINRKNFEKIDMVFIDGQEKYLPWKDKGYRLYEFIRLCKTTNKILFAAGVGMQFLIYYLATGSNTLFNFINSKGEIQAVEELEKIPINFLKKLKKNDYFLDYVTGDILEYHIINHNWSPIMNIGLHKQIAAEKFMARGKFILPDNFKGKDYISKPESTLVTNCHEIINKITREYLSHYLINNLPNEFVGFTSLTWFPHLFNVSFRKYNFQTICLSDKGISVIEHDNTVGVAFHPKKTYKETNILLENFIKQKFREVQTKLFKFQTKSIFQDVEEFPAMFRKFKYNDEENKRKYFSNLKNKLNKITKINFVENVYNSTAFNREKKVKNEAKHVGFGFNNRDMIFVENNAITQIPISFGNEDEKNKLKHKYTGIGLGDIFSLKRNENTRISEIFKPQYNLGTDFDKKENEKIKEIVKNEDDTGMDYLTFIRREKMDENQLIAYYKKTRRNVCLKLKEIDNFSNIKYIINKKNKIKKDKNNKLKLKIRTASSFYKNMNNLYPINKNIETENICNNDNNNLKKMEEEYNSLTNKINTRPIKTAHSSKNRIFSRMNDYIEEKEKIKNLNDKWKKYENLSPEQTQRRQFLESKKKWIAKEDFHRHFGIRSTSIKPIKNIMIYGEPVSSHKYRDINPSKWITPNGFI